MNHIEFFPYHNRHIVFKLKNGQELSGVLLDDMKHKSTGEYETNYTYIPTKNLIAWKLAEKSNDKKRQQELQSEIDIEEIVWAEQLNY